MEEYLAQESITEDDLRNKRLRPEAEDRLRHSIVLSEIAEAENVQVTATEVDTRVNQVKMQYTDQASQEEISRPEFRQQIGSRIVAEKTLTLLTKYANTK